jgi:DNA-binding LacI/PurR family transcriptional regulator
MYALATHLATVPATSEPTRITTTLYDLVDALSAQVGPDDDQLVTAAVMHLINSGHARFVGSWKQVAVVEA